MCPIPEIPSWPRSNPSAEALDWMDQVVMPSSSPARGLQGFVAAFIKVLEGFIKVLLDSVRFYEFLYWFIKV